MGPVSSAGNMQGEWCEGWKQEGSDGRLSMEPAETLSEAPCREKLGTTQASHSPMRHSQPGTERGAEGTAGF